MVSNYVAVATQLAVEAGGRLMELRETTLVKERKADHSLVTNADKEADQIIRAGLRKHFPDHAILTEESGLEGHSGTPFVWIVDPLDGTKAYVRGTQGFSVMIGLLKEGKTFAGVVYDPWQDRLYEAQRGEGCFHSFQGQRHKVQVSRRFDWSETPLVTSTDFPPKLEVKIKSALPCPWVPSLNSVGIKVGLLVRQVADLYVNHHAVHYWDTAAPQIILEEAGGAFTFSDGRPLAYDLGGTLRHGGPTLASNGRRHSEFVRIIHELL